MALALVNVALAEVQLGRLSSAARSLRVALETSMKVDAKTVVTGCLDVSAALAAARGKMHEAARLAGAASRLLEELGSVRDSSDRSLFERASNPFVRRSAPTRTRRSSAGGSCRSKRRLRSRSP